MLLKIPFSHWPNSRTAQAQIETSDDILMVYFALDDDTEATKLSHKKRLVLQIVQDTFENIEGFILTIKLAEISLEAFRINNMQ